MKRKLLTQIRAEWRSNIWLMLELLIASVVIWYIIDFFYVRISIYSQPKVHNIEHCYLLTFNNVTDKSPSFIPDRTDEEKIEDVFEILTRLENLPFVEAVSLSHLAVPYDGSNMTEMVQCDTMKASATSKMVTPDFVKVFRMTGKDGETSEELAEKLDRWEVLLSGNIFKKQTLLPDTLIGKNLYINGDTVYGYKVSATLLPIRYNDYYEGSNSFFIRLHPAFYDYAREYCIRVYSDQDKDIERQLMDMSENLFHVGNKLLVNVTSFAKKRDSFQQYEVNRIRDMSFILGFLMLNIFLGLFGTFWFRTGQRTSEIAIRLSMGARRSDIFRRLISEGLLLLVIVTPFAVAIDCLLAYNELNTYFSEGYLTLRRMAISCGTTFAVIALMIVAGVWIPALRAQKIAPAIALKDE